MILFTEMIIYKNVMGMGEKTRKEKKKRMKKSPFGLPSHLSFYNMEADRFRVSENAGNKLDLPYWY